MKKGMLFGLSLREKRVKKINLLHFPVFTSKVFVILKLPEPSTYSSRLSQSFTKYVETCVQIYAINQFV